MKKAAKTPFRPCKKNWRKGVSVLAILDPYAIGPYDFKKDTSHLLLLSLSRRRHRIFYGDPSSFIWDTEGLKVRTRQVTVLPSEPYFTFEEEKIIPVENFPLILMRKDPPVDPTYLHATQCLETVAGRVRIINHPESLRKFNEKTMILRFPEIPPTIVTSNKGDIDRFVEREGGVAMIKFLDSFSGKGVKKIVRGSPDYLTLLDEGVQGGRRLVMIQRYLPEISKGEKRVFMIDGKPWGVLLRMGERFAPATLAMREKKLCDNLTPFLKKNEIFFAGIDLIGEKLIEINITSPGLLWEWNEVDNCRHEEEIVNLLERKLS